MFVQLHMSLHKYCHLLFNDLNDTCSDGVARVFTADKGRLASPMEISVSVFTIDDSIVVILRRRHTCNLGIRSKIYEMAIVVE